VCRGSLRLVRKISLHKSSAAASGVSGSSASARPGEGGPELPRSLLRSTSVTRECSPEFHFTPGVTRCASCAADRPLHPTTTLLHNDISRRSGATAAASAMPRSRSPRVRKSPFQCATDVTHMLRCTAGTSDGNCEAAESWRSTTAIVRACRCATIVASPLWKSLPESESTGGSVGDAHACSADLSRHS